MKLRWKRFWSSHAAEINWKECFCVSPCGLSAGKTAIIALLLGRRVLLPPVMAAIAMALLRTIRDPGGFAFRQTEVSAGFSAFAMRLGSASTVC